MAQPEVIASADEQPVLDPADVTALLANDEPETPQIPADPIAAARTSRLADALIRSSQNALRRLDY